MAIVVTFDFPGATQANYDAVLKLLKQNGPFTSLADWPVKGVLSHVAGPTPTGWRVVDVWESEAAFQTFAEILGPMAQQAGFPNAAPQITPAYKFIGR